ncbi:NAD/FAD-binding protein [Terrihabitans soli]|uniref:NAD/FAD-binding protein n=1 Tax=Terrihabitans soli TaxID=708113 RepID=A0A6S6QU28_9HYPH|nr:NAD(P)/FAD-dependent oxidoreductase [Terrihabitans soli]BCJ90460.1 NAD/FAD-binding protein [Terrihabitans soli]
MEADLSDGPLNIAVIGSGISGLSCAWLLSARHRVTLYERAERLGGHAHTVDIGTKRPLPVDTGFIVYNERTYPNLTALFSHLGVPTKPSDMSFAVSLGGGRLEYSGTGFGGLFAQKSNLFRPRFWSMLRDLRRLYRNAPKDLVRLADSDISLGSYLNREGYSAALRDDHILPMAAAIWSTAARDVLDYPAASFLRFCCNHGLLQLNDRPEWRTVDGGSRVYVEKLARRISGTIYTGAGSARVRRTANGVIVDHGNGRKTLFDRVVIATHADQALALLDDPSPDEQRLLGAFRYSKNLAVLHCDEHLMPIRKTAWSSWNYLDANDELCVTYWMNRLQGIEGRNLFVTLNPAYPPRAGTILMSELYEHPLFDGAAMRAQEELWSLQGERQTWFCGAHFGSGFHEDGLQSGLAVAEQLGGVRRPWNVENESGRIHVRSVGMTEHAPS